MLMATCCTSGMHRANAMASMAKKLLHDFGWVTFVTAQHVRAGLATTRPHCGCERGQCSRNITGDSAYDAKAKWLADIVWECWKETFIRFVLDFGKGNVLVHLAGNPTRDKMTPAIQRIQAGT